jgi:4-oxalocrotonate tautomerase
MPVIRVEMLTGRTQSQKKELSAVLTRELARIVKCDVGHVQVIITEVERSNWSTGGVLESDR